MNKEGKLFEIFTAGCPVCERAVQAIKEAATDDCTITVYDLNKSCESNVCRERAEVYGIKTVPAVVINGELSTCCYKSGIDFESIKQQCRKV